VSNPHANRPSNAVSVLVADDDPIFRNLVAARLVKLHGRAVEAEDGLAAWELLSARSFDIAIIDLNMPNLDGFGLIRCVRGHPRTRHMPIIVITSQDDSHTIAEALSIGATSFLTKPVNWATFEHHLGFLLRLAENERRARTALQLANVMMRAKDMILSRLCREVIEFAPYVGQRLARCGGEAANSGPMVRNLPGVFEDLDRLATNATRAGHLAEMLSNGVSVDDKPAALSAILTTILGEARAAAAAGGIDLVHQPQSAEIDIRCDATSIELALAELVQNALTHAPRGSCVEISTKIYPDGLLAMEVTDHGQGMHPEFLASLFDSKRNCGLGDGAEIGFGLMIAKAVAEAHGGALEVRSMPGQGTTALFALPPDRVVTLSRTAA